MLQASMDYRKTKSIRMKKTFLLLLVLCTGFFVFAQNELLVQSNGRGLYLSHTVSPKENFYAIGRLYNVAPKEIAAFNDVDLNHGLAIGQTIKIPLTGSNFNQSANKGRPVYYIVGDKEGLYRVSLKNNKVLMADLRKWNNLGNDNISPGKKLIVGYLVSAEANAIVQTHPHAEPEKKEALEPPKKEIAAKKEIKEKKEAAEVVQKKEPEKTPEIPVNKPAFNPSAEPVVNDGKGGYFKSLFDKQTKVQPLKVDQTVSAGIFKTASGWQDLKYYALIDNVEPGTIIRIVNPTNNKAVYAKVLGEISGIRQNQGYDIRMSNAAASALEVSDTDKFIVKVNY